MDNAALLIIDMQNDFIRDGAPLQVPGAGAIIPNIRILLELFRRHRLPVFHVLRVHRADGSDVEISRRELFARRPFAVDGTRGARVIDELAPEAGEYIIKKVRMSAFFDTDLDLLLRSMGVGRVVVAGIQTPNCIRTTVFDAFAYNYRTYLVEDAVGAANEDVHRSNCRDMANIGTVMVHTADVEKILQS
ncbi:cysteine hydrolase family protein [Methanolinea mesophila]|uniref:cysteine hydrolase family protein n=1 Tax=Methanolinea mesophila TaxID=547055 RepID=UPI001AE6A8B1|nr:isochorismatase family cysteine hydrolase [Methanolinea mesophila]